MPDDLPPDSGGEHDSHWRDEGPDERPATPEGERQARLVSLILVIAVLGGIAAGLLLWPTLSKPGPKHVVSLIVWDHKHFPEHLVALADSDAILHHFADLPPAHLRHNKQSQARDDLESELKKLAKQQVGPVIIHICCQALARGGEVYLLPADADPDDDKTWLKLTEVFEFIGNCPAKKKTLVFLDISHPLADSRLGLLCDDVGEGVRRALETPPPFWVLTSCGPDQTALQCEAFGTSVFAHFVDLGLRGAADGWGPSGDLNKILMVKELAAYVRHQTDKWAQENRGLKQTPWLAGDGADFPLADLNLEPKQPVKVDELINLAKAVATDGKGAEKKGDAKADSKKEDAKGAAEKKDDGKAAAKKDDGKQADKGKDKGSNKTSDKGADKGADKEAEKTEPPKAPYPPELKEAWELREKLTGAPKDRLSPAMLLQIDLQLLRAEKNWSGGGPRDQLLGRNVKADLQYLVQKMQQMDKQLAKLGPAQGWDRPPTLALAMMSYVEPDTALVKTLAEKLKNVTVAPVNEELNEKERKELMKQEAEKKAAAQLDLALAYKESKEKLEPMQRAAALLKAAADPDLGSLNRLQMAVVREALARLLPSAEYVETLWLKRTIEFEKYISQDTKNQEIWAWPSDKMSQALRTLLASEELEVLLAKEPELLRWLDKARFRQAEEDRRDGEGRLFWGKPGQTAAGQPLHWKDAGDKLRQAEESYKSLYGVLSEVRAARAAYQDAILKLPGWFLYLNADTITEDDTPWQEPWGEARDLILALTRQLAAEPTSQDVAEIKAADLVRSLTKLGLWHEKMFEDSAKLAKEHAPLALSAIQALQAGPGLTVEQREQLWRTAHELDELYAKWEPDTTPVRTVATTPPEGSVDVQIRGARRKAELTLDLLMLAEAQAASARKEWDEVKTRASAPRDWEKLGWSLRKGWRTVERDAKGEAEAPAACIGRLFPLVPRDDDMEKLAVNEESKASSDFKTWLGARYRAEAKHFAEFDKSDAPVPTNSAFFSKTAARLER
jgi:hypothetical protein